MSKTTPKEQVGHETGGTGGGTSGAGARENGTATAEGGPGPAPQPFGEPPAVDELRAMTTQLHEERNQLLDRLSTIDAGLRLAAEELNNMLRMKPPKFRPPRGTRNGESGTQRILSILAKGNNRMARRELLEQAEKAGVSSPYSSLYSLEFGGRVKRDGDMIVLNDGTAKPRRRRKHKEHRDAAEAQ